MFNVSNQSLVTDLRISTGQRAVADYQLASVYFTKLTGRYRFPYRIGNLKDQFQPNLHVARQIGLSRDLAEVSAARVKVGVVENHLVKGVQELSPQL
jgi:hypothetical protein